MSKLSSSEVSNKRLSLSLVSSLKEGFYFIFDLTIVQIERSQILFVFLSFFIWFLDIFSHSFILCSAYKSLVFFTRDYRNFLSIDICSQINMCYYSLTTDENASLLQNVVYAVLSLRSHGNKVESHRFKVDCCVINKDTTTLD